MHKVWEIFTILHANLIIFSAGMPTGETGGVGGGRDRDLRAKGKRRQNYYPLYKDNDIGSLEVVKVEFLCMRRDPDTLKVTYG